MTISTDSLYETLYSGRLRIREVSEEQKQDWTKNGQHSGFPSCCIEWFCGRYGKATSASNRRYMRLLKHWHETGKYLWQPGFIPCPKTIRAKDIVFIHHCEDTCRTKRRKAIEGLQSDHYRAVVHPDSYRWLNDSMMSVDVSEDSFFPVAYSAAQEEAYRSTMRRYRSPGADPLLDRDSGAV